MDETALLQEHDNPTCRTGSFVLSMARYSKEWQARRIGRKGFKTHVEMATLMSHGRQELQLQEVMKEEKKRKGGVFPSGSLLQIFSWKQRIDSAVLGNRIKHTKLCIDKNRYPEVSTSYFLGWYCKARTIHNFAGMHGYIHMPVSPSSQFSSLPKKGAFSTTHLCKSHLQFIKQILHLRMP